MPKQVWFDENTNLYYELDDPRFVGQGRPPSFPWGPGAGRYQLEQKRVADSKKTEPKGRNPYKREPKNGPIDVG